MRISFVEKETTMTTDKNNSCYPGATAPGFKIAARFARRERRCCFYKLFRLFPKELIGKAPQSCKRELLILRIQVLACCCNRLYASRNLIPYFAVVSFSPGE